MTTLELIAPLLLSANLLTVQLSASAQQSDPLAPFGSLRLDLELRSEHHGWSLEYCPDNTCERFSCHTGSCDASLLDFGFLYLSHVSGYTYLSHFRGEEAPTVTPSLLARYKDVCPQSAERDAVVCILRTLHKNAKVRMSFVRYDEGERNEEPVDLEEELRRSAHR